MKEIKITWIDSVGAQGGWQFLEDCEVEICEVTTYGFLVRETDKSYVVAQSYSPATEGNSEQVNGVIAIPKVAVTSFCEIDSSYLKFKDLQLGYPGIYFYDGKKLHFQGNPAMVENHDFAMNQQEEKQKEQKPELVQQPPITYTYNSNASRDERLKAALLALLNSDLIKVAGNKFSKQDLIEWVEKHYTNNSKN